jgi:hypothetical protein
VVSSRSANKKIVGPSKRSRPPRPAGTAVIISISSKQRLQSDRQASGRCVVCVFSAGGGCVQYRCSAAAPALVLTTHLVTLLLLPLLPSPMTQQHFHGANRQRHLGGGGNQRSP